MARLVGSQGSTDSEPYTSTTRTCCQPECIIIRLGYFPILGYSDIPLSVGGKSPLTPNYYHPESLLLTGVFPVANPIKHKLRTAHYFKFSIRNLRLSKNFLPFGRRVAVRRFAQKRINGAKALTRAPLPPKIEVTVSTEH